MIGAVSAPQFLAATDTVELARVDMSSAVETIPLPEPEPEPVVVAKAPVAGTVRDVAPTMRNYDTVNSDIILMEPGGVIRQTGKFIYGHNTGPLGSIVNLQSQEVFMVNGVQYRVAYSQVFELNPVNRYLKQDGTDTNDKQLTKDVEINAMGHHISMMTCYGHYVPSMGTYSHRWVVFADRV